MKDQKSMRAPRLLYYYGVGGSGIAGAIAGMTAEKDARFEDAIVMSDEKKPPGTALRVFLSYSGNTHEVLEAYGRWGGRSAVCVCSGGRLFQRATRDGAMVIRLPRGIAPRFALPHFLGALWALAVPFKKQQPPKYLGALRELTRRLPEIREKAESLADDLAGDPDTVEFVATYPGLRPVGHRWVSQLCESAKALAAHFPVPESLHNLLVPLCVSGLRTRVVLLLGGDGSAMHEKQVGALVGTLSEYGRRPPVVVRAPAGISGTVATLYLTLLGDFTSVYLAQKRGVAVLPVQPIETYKQRLSALEGRNADTLI